MEGVDHNWINSGMRNEVTYSQLRPGNYILHVQGSNEDGVWNEKGISLNIHVATPWFQSWWFFLLCACVGGSLIYFIYYFSLKKKLEKQQALTSERLRISRDLHDDMGASLSSISVFSSAVKQKLLNNETEEAKQLLDRMSTDAQEMVTGMSEMVWTISPDNDTVEKLTDRLQVYAAGMLMAKNISFRLECNEELKTRKLSVDFRKNVFLIFKEAINNAAKYSEATEVTLVVSKNDNRFIAVLSDNGKGFDISSGQNGNGLKNMVQRAKAFQSELQVKSEINKGTSVTFDCLLPKIGEM
jgi:signal transduction histidine kinase